MRQKLGSITQFVRLPAICRLCKQFHQGSLAICAFCAGLIRPLGTACYQCGNPLPTDVHPICGHCIKNPPHFDRALIHYPFVEPLRSLLHQFKYHQGLYLAPFLSHLMQQALEPGTPKPQCLLPVPMHPKRLQQRGFNQAAVLTQCLGKDLCLPYLLTSCRKVINTPPQASLDAQGRQANLIKAFQVSPLPYQHVAIVDDLLTTGNTANALASALKKSGVERVDIWCCARVVMAF